MEPFSQCFAVYFFRRINLDKKNLIIFDFLGGNLTTQFISLGQVAICKIGGFSDP
jgi:hypothetical protein